MRRARSRCNEAQLVYLKQALDVNPKDADVNRKCGRALADQGAFDQAISCWNRVIAAKPGDEEASRALGDLAVERTISKGKYEDAESGQDVRADKFEQITGDDNKYTPQQRLEKHLVKNPADIAKYFELADLHTREERHADAEAVITKALEASGGEVVVRERLEDAQLRTARANLDIARKKAEKERTQDAVNLFNKFKKELRARELEYYRSRSERYPNKLNFKYELALRLKKVWRDGRSDQDVSGGPGRPQDEGEVPPGARRMLPDDQAVQAGHAELRGRSGSHQRPRSRRPQAGAVSGRQALPGARQQAAGRKAGRPRAWKSWIGPKST